MIPRTYMNAGEAHRETYILSNIISTHFVLLAYDGIFLFGALDLAVLILMKVHFENCLTQPFNTMSSHFLDLKSAKACIANPI